MSLRVLVGMNLSPDWVNFLTGAGWPAVHWSLIGDPRARDQELMDWARANQHVVLTHDLGFGTLLAVTNADGPSVIQVRTQDVMPAALGPVVDAVLATGALIVVDASRTRVRVLPLNPGAAP